MGAGKKQIAGWKRTKSVDKVLFEEQVGRVLNGEVSMRLAGGACGLSHATFELRFKQYVNPEKYGNLPEGFFITAEKREHDKPVDLPDLTEYI